MPHLRQAGIRKYLLHLLLRHHQLVDVLNVHQEQNVQNVQQIIIQILMGFVKHVVQFIVQNVHKIKKNVQNVKLAIILMELNVKNVQMQCQHVLNVHQLQYVRNVNKHIIQQQEDVQHVNLKDVQMIVIQKMEHVQIV